MTHSTAPKAPTMRKITFEELPAKAKKAFSEEQLSYIDEFSFEEHEFEGLTWIECWGTKCQANSFIVCEYAGDLLGSWLNNTWIFNE
jgi:hypothetical protein